MIIYDAFDFLWCIGRYFGRRSVADSDAIWARLQAYSGRGFERHRGAGSSAVVAQVHPPSWRGFIHLRGTGSGAISARFDVDADAISSGNPSAFTSTFGVLFRVRGRVVTAFVRLDIHPSLG